MFYRPAEEEDFEKFEVEMDNRRGLDDDVKLCIEQGDVFKAHTLLRQRYGYGAVQARTYTAPYVKYLQAKKDFKEGKTVFVPY